MRNIRLLLEYDGTSYHGWQMQGPGAGSRKTVLTIQEIVQSALKKITGEDVKLLGASRTDAGVHALGQVASFKYDSNLEPGVLKRALNAVLPEDIRILDADEADIKFHPRYDALGKSYFYIIENRDTPSAFLHKYAWRLPHKLDIRKMGKAAGTLIGRHDFSAFRGAGCGAKNTIREITSLEIKTMKKIDFMTAGLEGKFIKIRIEANAFLRHMVRNIVGTLVEVGRGKMSVDSAAEALEHGDRKLTGPTAPSKGLFLEKINY